MIKMTFKLQMFMSCVFAGATLLGCGGGGDSTMPTPPPPPVTAPPPDNGSNIPPISPRTPVPVPGLDTRAVQLVSPSITWQANAQSMHIKVAGKSNLDLVGNNNNVWVSEGQAMERISIQGQSNTIVMMKGATVTSFTVSAGNTVYLPLDSSIIVGGNGATVKYYIVN